jgi:hypothetical protein
MADSNFSRALKGLWQRNANVHPIASGGFGRKLIQAQRNLAGVISLGLTSVTDKF